MNPLIWELFAITEGYSVIHTMFVAKALLQPDFYFINTRQGQKVFLIGNWRIALPSTPMFKEQSNSDNGGFKLVTDHSLPFSPPQQALECDWSHLNGVIATNGMLFNSLEYG